MRKEKADYGEITLSIEVRENGIIIDGPMNANEMKGISAFLEFVMPNAVCCQTPLDNKRGGMALTLPKKEEIEGAGEAVDKIIGKEIIDDTLEGAIGLTGGIKNA